MHPLNLEPDTDDLYEFEPTGLPAVPVAVEGPIRTQAPADDEGAIYTVVADDVTGIKLWNEDPRRARAIVCAIDQPMFLAYSREEVQASNAAQWPVGVPLQLDARRRVFVRSATDGEAVTVTVVLGQWTR